jgi:hypothetical protein
MPSVANLAVSVTARTNKFRSGMKGAGRSVRQFTDNVNMLRNRLLALGAGFVGIAGIKRFASFISEQARAIDAISKLSDRIGIATKDLVLFQHVAERSGVGTELLNKGLQEVVRRVGEVADGTGEAKDSLDKLGLSAKQLIQLPTAKMFRLIIERLRGVGNDALRAQRAYDLFGRSSKALQSIIALTNDEWRELEKRTRAIGGVFTRVQGAQVEAMNDAMDDLREKMAAVGRQIAILSSKHIRGLADALFSLGPDAASVAQALEMHFNTIRFAWAIAVDDMTKRWLQFFKALKGIEAIPRIIQKSIGTAAGPLQNISTVLAGTALGLRKQPGAASVFDALSIATAKASGQFKETEENATNALRNILQDTGKVGDETQRTNRLWDQSLDLLDKWWDDAGRVAEMRKEFEKIGDELARVALKAKSVRSTFKSGTAGIIEPFKVIFSGMGNPARTQAVHDPANDEIVRQLRGIRSDLSTGLVGVAG